MEESKKQFIEAVKQATNILVTVRSSPSIDQLAACIALTLMLNEMGKHATAVFSGEIPSVLEFLEPEKTLQPTADSLQDFIISLDKAKADKLRYKVEDTVVRIYITPFKTSLTSADLEFGQGDYNVDVVIALGVHAQADLDEAITAHGRILHDATVVSVNTTPGADKDLGSVNWLNENVSSLSEMLAASIDDLAGDKKDVLDNQVATALLTGIVAETDRFGNSKTTPETMQVSAKLLTAGANQELVATKLAAPAPPEATTKADAAYDADAMTGLLEIRSPEVSETLPAALATEAGQGDSSVDTPHDDGSLDIDHDAAVAPTVDAVEIVDETPKLPEISVVRAEAGDGQAVNSHSPDGDASPTPFADAELSMNSDTAEPKSYDLNQISVPASIPITPAEHDLLPSLAENTTDTPEPETNQPAQALAGVDEEHSNIQPLRDQNNFLAQPPLHEKTLDPSASTNGGSVDDTLDPTKFAVTPPSMGGTLTAGRDQSDVDAANDPMAGSMIRSRSIMKHDSQVFPGAEHGQLSESDLEGDDKGLASEPSQGLDPNAEPTENTGLPQFGLIHSGGGSDEAEAVAPSAKHSHIIEPSTALTASDDSQNTQATNDFSDLTASLINPSLAEDNAMIAPVSPTTSARDHETLAELETELNSPHLAQLATPDMTMPEMKPLDMPFPSAVPDAVPQPALEVVAIDHSADVPHSPPSAAPPFMPLSGSVG